MNLSTVQYLYKIGHLDNELCSINAIQYFDIKILEWLYQNNILNITWCLEYATINNYPKVIKWIYEIKELKKKIE